MNLNKIERLLLINQFKILEQLYPDEADYYHTQRKALERGYTRHYQDMFQWIAEEMSEEDCNEIMEILELHRVLKDAYNNLENTEGIDPSDIKFVGFDGNEESRVLLYATYCMQELGGYSELRNSESSPVYNSPCPTLGRYRHMVKVWENKSKNRNLSKEDIVDIVKG